MSKGKKRLDRKEPMFEKALYSIVVENVKHENWFTEKLLDCLVTKTIPIYWGSPNIGDFFNLDGFIIFRDEKDLLQQIGTLSVEYYYQKLKSLEDNYQRALKYRTFWPRVYENIEKYIKEI
jgi:hypothetical protein